MTHKASLRAELKEYMKTIGDLSTTEKQEIQAWVADGNSVYDNPFLLYGENGWLMDYITAYRVNADMYEDYINSTNLFRYGAEAEPDEDPDIPF